MKRHHEALANALNGTRPGENWDANKRVQWNMDVKTIAGVCFSFNPGFDMEKFIQTCGGLFNV